MTALDIEDPVIRDLDITDTDTKNPDKKDSVIRDINDPDTKDQNIKDSDMSY